MEIHDRLMNVPTTGLMILDILTDDQDKKSLIIRQLLEACNKKISNNRPDLKVLETFRMILCYEYQTFINSGIRWSSFKTNDSKIHIDTFFVRDIDNFDNTEEFAFLYDIAILQLAFNCNNKTLIASFKDFYESQKEHLATRQETLCLCLKVLECITDSYNLHSRLYKKNDQKQEFEQLPNCILNIIELWMKQETNVQSHILAKLLPKLVSIFGAPNVLTPLWNKILDDKTDLHRILDMLCVTADICFPSEENLMRQMQYEYCVSAEFWLILLRSLDSNIYQERKKGLYLMKRVLDFIESNQSQIRIHVDLAKAWMVPFVSTDTVSRENTTDLLMKYFFLILESSEEKQKHFVLPALTYLPNLVEAYSVRKCQSFNFHRMWLQCIFKRILRHNNVAIKKCALREILEADVDIYDEGLLDFLANFLNNIALYDFDYTEAPYPETVAQLTEFFLRSDQARVPLINDFVRAISKISWCPVAIYWILKALVIAVDSGNILYNMWGPEELRSVRNLVTFNLPNYCRKLHHDAEILIQMAFCKYMATNSYWSDVELVTSTINSIGKVSFSPVYHHVAKILKASDAQSYVSDQCRTLWPQQSSKSFAATIILFVGSNLILCEKNCHAERSLHELFQSLSNVHRRFYTDKTAILKVLELASYLMESVSRESEFEYASRINRLLSSYLQALFRIVGSCFEKATIPEHEHITVTRALIEYSIDNEIDNLKNFYDQCIDFVCNSNKLGKYHWLFALKAINVYNRCYSHEHSRFANNLNTTKIQFMLKYFKEEILNDGREENTKINENFDRKIVSDCSQNVATIVCNYIRREHSNDQAERSFWLQDLALLIETGPEENISVVTETILDPLIRYQQLTIEDISIIMSIVRLSCRQVIQLKKTKVFFDAVKSLTELIVNSQFLKLNEAKEIAIEWVNQLMIEGTKVPFLRNSFVTQVKNLDEQDALLFLQPFIGCLLHGETPRHDQKIELAAVYYDRSEDAQCDINMKIRAQAVVSLVTLLERSKSSESRFRENLLQGILLILNKHRNKRYFDNSHVHRLKQRAMQALLVLGPYLNEKEVQSLYDEICDLLIAESNQPSVRLLQEWLIVRIYANSFMDESIWKLFEKAMEKRPGSIVSVASIVYHISLVQEEETKIKFISKAISHLLPNCMSQQFNVRLYSQVILVKLYEMLPQSSRYQCKIIVEGVQESLRHGNLTKNSPKVMDDFYFTQFHSNEDYNLEIIYKHLPRLTGSSADEWIELDVFMSLITIREDFPIALECSSKWKSIKSTKPLPKSAGGDFGEEIDSTNEGGLSDIQKKIIPWKSMTPFTDELSQVSKAALERKTTLNDDDAGIIVVASLIDRPPNLGGLARTCEIFGAKELVIGSLRYADDREFQTLSVSAEKWITITEVKAHLLKNYLLEQRGKGWKLVGAEQTANSTNLLAMEFHKKTVLLLGNEKDGIPANLIPLLDTCVEIPQNGVIRSLNVHVTGAICIWQYAKQHVLV